MIDIKENISLKPYHTFHMDIQARYFVEYDTVAELKELLASSLLKDNKFLHIGGGSNLLFTKDYDGVVLHSRMNSVRRMDGGNDFVYVVAESGMVWDDFVAYCVDAGLGGVENLSNIPGEVGASAIQNIGAYGVEVKDVIDSVFCIDVETLQERVFSNAECRYSYRSSIFKQELRGRYIVTAVKYVLRKKPEFRLEYGNLRTILGDAPISLESVRNAVITVRSRKLPDPDIVGSAGSFFVNPIVGREHYSRLLSEYPGMPAYPAEEGKVKLSAAWLIDNAGGHGKRVGGAAVYHKQCLVIVNENDAFPEDVVALAELIRKCVFEKYHVELTPEVNFI